MRGRPTVMGRRCLRLEVLPDASAVTEELARRVSALVASQRRVTLGLATGETMRPVYDRLVAAHRDRLSFAGVTSFNLDEYVGLSPDHPSSFAAFMRRAFFEGADIPKAQRHIPLGTAGDLDAEATAYEQAIAAAGGIDLQILGIGENGHIAFNEPGSDLGSRTRCVALAEGTRMANAAAFPDRDVPTHAITMGIATILSAREILAAAVGPRKAQAVAQAFEGPVTTACPASALRLHAAATILCDPEAASLLTPSPVRAGAFHHHLMTPGELCATS